MALQISTILDRGIVATECYAKITKIVFLKSSDLDDELVGPRVSVAFYFNRAARDTNERNFTEEREYQFPNFVHETRQSQYNYLKTLPDFAGAIDVIDDDFTGDTNLVAEVSGSFTGDTYLANE